MSLIRRKQSNDRAMKVYQLKQEGKTLEEIGLQIGVSASRAGQIYSKGKWLAAQIGKWDEGLAYSLKWHLSEKGYKNRVFVK